MLDRSELKRMVAAEFGTDLSGVTPEKARAFLDRAQLLMGAPTPGVPIVLNEPATSYDEVMRGFFARVLDSEEDAACVLLWLTAFELWVDARYG
jgi:hypothetical protein